MSTKITLSSHIFDRVTVACAWVDGEPAEVGRVYVRDELDHDYYYIHGLWVHPDYRKQGIGTRLMRDILDLYVLDRLELIPARADGEDGPSGTDLAAWYQRLGFKFGPSNNTDRGARESDVRRMYRPGIRA